MMVQYFGAEPGDVQQEIDDTRECHARFGFFESLYRYHLNATVQADGEYHEWHIIKYV